MSFFTNNAYASFHQHLPPASTPSSKTRTSPPKQLLASQFAGRLDNSSFMSTTSTASTISEFDPLSPLNLTRAADPWHGNSLLTPNSYYGESQSSAFSCSSTANIAATSLKVYASDQTNDDDDEEWGEFMNFSMTKDQEQEHLAEERGVRATVASKPSTSRRAKKASDREYASEGGRSGWQRIPRANSRESDDADGGASDEDDREVYQAIPYNRAPPLPQYHSNNGFQEKRARTPAMAPESFVSAILSRLSSFGSSSNLNDARRASLSSWSTRLFSGNDETFATPTAAARGYDSYDVTFEKGPIGLELETDWYGRQAVVKGFKKVQSDQDGPAKLCGIIRIGDVLTAINGDSCLEMSFQETLARLREIGKGKHVLHFKSLEAAGDLSVYNNDMDIIQAKKFIHQHKEKFYRQPPPSANKELIYGCIERIRGETVTAFNFHREDTGEFLLACSCVNEGTGVFIFHTLQDSHLREFKDLPQNEDSAVYLGQMVPNFLGTEFTVLDHQQKRRNELGFLVYSSNVMGRVPNFLKCVFPRQPPVTEEDADSAPGDEVDNNTVTSRPRAATTGSGMGSNSASYNLHNTMMDRNGNISERYKKLKQSRTLSIVERLRHFSLDDLETSLEYAGGNLEALWHDSDDHAGRARSMRMKNSRSASSRDLSTPYGAVEQNEYQCDLLTFETKKPAWNDELCAWTLNFHGRVKLASKKNFLLVPEQGNEQMETEFSDEKVFLRFGKVSKTRFSLDYQAPISPLMAVAIVCSSFAHKIAVT